MLVGPLEVLSRKSVPFKLTVSFLMDNLLNKIEIYDNAFKLDEQKIFEKMVFIAIKHYESVSLCVALEFLRLRGE